MKKKIDISIILIVRNNWEEIEKCLKSIMRQPGIELEVILLNDDSDDGASAHIKQFADNHEFINLFEQKYKGILQSRNKAIRQIKGKYTLFLNQEQELLPYSLQIAFKDALNSKADILQMPYMEVDGKKERIVKMPSLKEPLKGSQYIKAIGGKHILNTECYANLINSEYLSDKIMRFDYRLTDNFDFDFFAKAITGADSVFTTLTPVCISRTKTYRSITTDDKTIKEFNQNREYIRKNFNEYADNHYFSTEEINLLRYLRNINLLNYSIEELKKAMPEKDFSKWVKYMTENLTEYGGWKNIGRLKLKYKLKKYLKEATKSSEQ